MNLYGVCYKMLGQLGVENVWVVRRSGQANHNGRIPTYPTVAKYNIFAIVTSVDPSNVVRDPAHEYSANTIEVNTNFALRGPAPNPDILSDEIWYQGQSYLIVNIRSHIKDGVGFVIALCERMQQSAIPNFGALPHSLAEEDVREITTQPQFPAEPALSRPLAIGGQIVAQSGATLDLIQSLAIGGQIVAQSGATLDLIQPLAIGGQIVTQSSATIE
jgi:hypothetical protein